MIHRGAGAAEALDIKQGGITLITNLARTYSLMSGLSENRTLRRLHGAAGHGPSRRTRWSMVSRRRSGCSGRRGSSTRSARALGQAPDDQVDPSTLGPLARQGLKDAFRIIDAAQDRLANVLGVGR